jgi:ABC-type transporter MlaC component
MMEKCLSSRLSNAAGLLFGGVAFLCIISHAAAATPLEVVKSTNGQVLSIYGKHRVVDAAVEKEIFAVIDPITDYQAIANGAIDPLCPKLTAAQCTTFKEVFTRLLRVSSIKKLGRARAGRFEYEGEKITGETAVVRSFAYFDEEKIPLDYQMARRGDTWVIVNYVVDDVDTVRNYRKQFTQLLGKKTFDQVMEQLEKKIASLEKEK